MDSVKCVVLGVTGSIAAYKAADLASRLVKAGYAVDVIMTRSAMEFITPLTFQAITGRSVVTDMFALQREMNVQHVALAQKADILVIAPGSANTLARIAHGFADDMLTCTALATRAPILIAPAMNTGMWENPVTQENMDKLRSRGCSFVGPESGRLACGDVGYGKMSEPEAILDSIETVLGRTGPLAGRRILVTAGGTREPMDPVREITNRSSGKMGFHIARVARNMGALVDLVTTVPLPHMAGVERIRVGTALEMLAAVKAKVPECDALIMAAAPGDYRVGEPSAHKIKKCKGGFGTLSLVENPDILRSVTGGFVKVAFAAESEDLLENAGRKLREKGADLIVANDITAPGIGFGSDDNAVTLMESDGRMKEYPMLPKEKVAEIILLRVTEILAERDKPKVDPDSSI